MSITDEFRLAEENERLRARLAKAREALRPFTSGERQVANEFETQAWVLVECAAISKAEEALSDDEPAAPVPTFRVLTEEEAASMGVGSDDESGGGG